MNEIILAAKNQIQITIWIKIGDSNIFAIMNSIRDISIVYKITLSIIGKNNIALKFIC